VTALSPIKFGEYWIERRLSETFRANCPRCGWLGDSRTDLVDVLTDLREHVGKTVGEFGHKDLPLALSYA
jgi:hypothetical protein